ncbi:glycosyltransferase family 4 protein [Patescibacteria group bacterium]
MKIAQVVSTYPPYRGGMGAVAYEYTERLRQRGHNVHVYTPSYRKVKDELKYVHRLPSALTIGNAGVVPSLYKRLAGFDIIHLHYPFFGGAEPVVVRKAIRQDQRLVITYHMDSTGAGLKGVVFNAHRRLLFPWLMARADRILVSSQDYANSCALQELEKIENRIEIHPFGVDLVKFFPGQEPELKAELGIASDTPVLLFVGGLDQAHHFKGLPVLLEALKGMVESKWHLVVVGEGNLRASFEAKTAANGLSERVTFTGPIEDKLLPNYYRLAQIHLFPSTERAEAFGLVALEASASGVPSIASDLSGVRSVVLNGETGLLVPPANSVELAQAISLLLEQVDLRERLGLSARKRAESEFAWEPLISKLEQTYQTL